MPLGGGTHFSGPILGAGNASDGLMRNADIGVIGRMKSKYKFWFEDFRASLAPTADGLVAAVAGTGMNGAGWTVTQIGAVAGNTVGTIERTCQLLVNCGTAADTGYNLQHNFALTAAATQPHHDVMGPFTSTAPGMDERELIFATRLNYIHTGAWGSKFFVGIAVTDTALMTPGTGDMASTVATGGCVGFHVGETGVLSAAQHRTGGAVTVNFTPLKTAIDSHATTAFTSDNWLELGFRMSYGDASDAADPKNITDWYINDRKILTTRLNNPITSTQAYSVSIEAMNGGAGTEAFDLGIDYIYTGLSRIGDARLLNP